MSYAGVLPFAIDRDGRVWLLLGQEQKSRNPRASLRWSDFGGTIDRDERVLDAAAREAFEESMGLLGTAEELVERLAHCTTVRTTNNRGAHYLMQIYLEPALPLMFNRFYHYAQISALAANSELPSTRAGFWEKVRAAWLPLDSLEQQVHLRAEFAQDLVSLKSALLAHAQRR